MPAALSDPISPQEEAVRAQILGLLRACGVEWAPRTCEVGAAVGLETHEVGFSLAGLERAGKVRGFERAGQVVWAIRLPGSTIERPEQTGPRLDQ
jgi:hypothetical protein